MNTVEELETKKTNINAKRGIKEAILNLRKKNKSYREIQAILNCSKGTVEYHCKRENLNGTIEYRHHREISDKLKKEIYKFTKRNTVISDAMKKFKVSRKTIQKYGCFDK